MADSAPVYARVCPRPARGDLGTLLAFAGLKLLLLFAPVVPRTSEIKVDLMVLGFTLALSVVAVFCLTHPLAQIRGQLASADSWPGNAFHRC